MQSSELIYKYFPKLTLEQKDIFQKLSVLYEEWNSQINVISRKDMDNFYERHVLHSLSIAEFIDFHVGTNILDLGTGGGFPGIPLAIMFPKAHFTLVDSTGKKMHVVKAITEALKLKNVTPIATRGEYLPKGQFHFIVTRAVASMHQLIEWGQPLLTKNDSESIPNGILALKGGDLKEELKGIRCTTHPLSDWFEEEFFETKHLVYWYPRHKVK